MRKAVIVPAVGIAAGLGVLAPTSCLGGGSDGKQRPPSGAPVVVALGAEPENFNPVFGDIFGTFYGDKWPMFNGLLRRRGDLELEPDLAAASPEVSEDGKTVTVALRRGVRFHDGVELTADDVVFTYRSILDPNVATTLRDLLDDTLAEVEAVNRYTVRFSLKRVNPSFPDTLEFGIVPKHRLEGEGLNKTPFNTREPVGTGPFVFERFQKGDRVVMKANPEFFRGAPKVGRLVFAIVEDENQRATLMAEGDVDVDVSALAPGVAARFEDDPDVRLLKIPGDARALTLPNDNPVLRDARVRRALGLAIDREAIVDGVFRGSAEPVFGPLMPGHWAHDPRLVVAFDPGRADRELTAAGWRDGDRDGVRENAGRKLRFKLAYIADDSVGKDLALAVRSELGKVGARVELEGRGFDAYSEELGKGAAVVNDQATVFDPELDLPELYGSNFASDDEPFTNGAACASARSMAPSRAQARRSTVRSESRRITRCSARSSTTAAGSTWCAGSSSSPSRAALALEPLRQEGHLHGFSRAMLANVEDWSLRESSP